MFKRSQKSKSNKPIAGARKPWLWTKEGERESFFQLDAKGRVSAPTHQTHAPWEDEGGTNTHSAEHVGVDVISFCKDDDWEVKAEARESEEALKKRLMADVGVKVLGWTQALKTDAQSTNPLADLKRLAGHLKEKPSAQPSESKLQTLSSGVEGTWLYATSQQRMQSIPAQTRVWSGLSLVRYLLDQALKSAANSVSWPETPFVTGVVFTGEPTTVIVFLKCDGAGQFSLPQVVRLADFSAEAFASACANYAELVRLGRDLPQERIKLFDGAHVMELITPKGREAKTMLLRPYPSEVEIFGVRQRRWIRGAFYATALALAVDCLVGLSALGLAATKRAENQKTQERVQQQELVRKADLDQRFKTLIELGSVPVNQLIDQARSMYRDGMRLEIEATRANVVYRVSRRFQDESSQPAAMADLLQIQPPENCRRNAPETTLQLNEVFVYVECQTVDPYLARVLSAGS